MASQQRKVQRTVAFYRLTQQRRNDNSTLTNEQVKENFRNILRQENGTTQNKSIAFRLKIDNKNAYIEVAEFNDDEGYAKITIGYGNPRETVALRNMSTLESNEIQMEKYQEVETYTYCYLDFNTCIVSYIRSITAPHIDALNYLLNRNNPDIVSAVSAIVYEDAIKMLENKRISKIEVIIACPSDDILSNRIGLDRDTFLNVGEGSIGSYTYTITGKRGMNLIKEGASLTDLTAFIQNKYQNKLKDLKITAAEQGDRAQVYSLIRNSITAGKRVRMEESSLGDRDNIFNELIQCYKENKDSLSQCMDVN